MKTFVNPKYERREGEDAYEYGLRLIEIKVEQKPDDLDWEDIVEATGIECHRDSLRKAASVTPYSGYAVAQYFKKKYAAQGNPGQDDYMGELNCKIAEMRKEAKRFYDQRREFNKMVDRMGREENLEDRLELNTSSGPWCASSDTSNRSLMIRDMTLPVLCSSKKEKGIVSIWRNRSRRMSPCIRTPSTCPQYPTTKVKMLLTA